MLLGGRAAGEAGASRGGSLPGIPINFRAYHPNEAKQLLCAPPPPPAGKTTNGYSHDNKQRGVYVSALGGLPLFSSDTKFNSGTVRACG